MNSKLTLTIEESLIAKAEKYARTHESNLSDLIESYLKALTEGFEEDEVEITPLVKSLKGSFAAPKDFDYKKELEKRLSGKYL